MVQQWYWIGKIQNSIAQFSWTLFWGSTIKESVPLLDLRLLKPRSHSAVDYCNHGKTMGRLGNWKIFESWLRRFFFPLCGGILLFFFPFNICRLTTDFWDWNYFFFFVFFFFFFFAGVWDLEKLNAWIVKSKCTFNIQIL